MWRMMGRTAPRRQKGSPVTLRTLFTLTAALMLFFGAGFLLAPEAVFGLYGVALDPAGVMLANVAGAAVLSLGVLA